MWIKTVWYEDAAATIRKCAVQFRKLSSTTLVGLPYDANVEWSNDDLEGICEDQLWKIIKVSKKKLLYVFTMYIF